MDNQSHPGEGPAIASLILGIIACLSVFVYLFSAQLYTGVIAVITGFVGIVMENAAKNSGYSGGLRIAGAVVSWVGAAIGAAICGKLLFIMLFCLVEIYPLATHSSLKLPCH